MRPTTHPASLIALIILTLLTTACHKPAHDIAKDGGYDFKHFHFEAEVCQGGTAPGYDPMHCKMNGLDIEATGASLMLGEVCAIHKICNLALTTDERDQLNHWLEDADVPALAKAKRSCPEETDATRYQIVVIKDGQVTEVRDQEPCNGATANSALHQLESRLVAFMESKRAGQH